MRIRTDRLGIELRPISPDPKACYMISVTGRVGKRNLMPLHLAERATSKPHDPTIKCRGRMLGGKVRGADGAPRPVSRSENTGIRGRRKANRSTDEADHSGHMRICHCIRILCGENPGGKAYSPSTLTDPLLCSSTLAYRIHLPCSAYSLRSLPWLRDQEARPLSDRHIRL